MTRALVFALLLLAACGPPGAAPLDPDSGTAQNPSDGGGGLGPDAGAPGDAGSLADAGGAPDAGAAGDAGQGGAATPRGAEARAIVADGGRLVDVRTVTEFNGGHIAGARNIPLAELPGRLVELEPKDAWVVVYCRSGNRSAQAAGVLTDGGFSKVFDLGPMTAW